VSSVPLPAAHPTGRGRLTGTAALALPPLGYLLVQAVHTGGGTPLSALVPPHLPATTVLVRVLFLLALVTSAGIGLTRALLGDRPELPAVRVTGLVSAGVGVLLCLVDILGEQSSPLLSGLVAVLLAAAALYSWAGRHRLGVATHALVGAALAVMAATELGAVRSGVAQVCDWVFAVAAALLFGGVLHGVALTRRAARPEPRELTLRAAFTDPAGNRLGRAAADAGPSVSDGTAGRRLDLVARGSGTVAALAASVQLALSGPGTTTDALGAYGIVGAGCALLALLATLAWTLRGTTSRTTAGTTSGTTAGTPRRGGAGLGVLAAGLAVLAVAAAAALAALAPPPPAPAAGQPLLRPVRLGGRPLAVLVTPMRPGANLVHLTGQGDVPLPTVTARAGDGPARPLTARPGAAGGWATVNLPAGSATLELAAGPDTASVPVDTGHAPAPADSAALAGPGGPECASAATGAVLAGGRVAPRCPSLALSPSDAGSLRAAVAFLAAHGVTTLDVAADGSPRGRAAEQVVRAQAGASRLAVSAAPGPDDTLLLLTGWDRAPHELRALAARVTDGSRGGVVLAPWLATAPVLGQAASELVPLTFDPGQSQARAYTRALSTALPGEAASPSGYLAWSAALGTPPAGPPAFFGATRTPPPGGAGQDGGPGGQGQGSRQPDTGGWYPAGTVTRLPAGNTP
jgi:hypothetical protein